MENITKRKKLATIWLGGCSGCHMSLLDMDERILEIARLADIVKSPIVDTKEMPEVDLALVEGSVTSDEHARELQLIRRRARKLLAFGDCAVTTNITGMRNYFDREAVLKTSYGQAASDDGKGVMPSHPALLRLRDKVLPLQEVVAVDFVIPGCPPDADTIFYVLHEFLNDRVPDLAGAKKLKYG